MASPLFRFAVPASLPCLLEEPSIQLLNSLLGVLEAFLPASPRDLRTLSRVSHPDSKYWRLFANRPAREGEVISPLWPPRLSVDILFQRPFCGELGFIDGHLAHFRNASFSLLQVDVVVGLHLRAAALAVGSRLIQSHLVRCFAFKS
eukprot:m.309177 g.309177  ORF g.309177 m.309177 type:complete len:147 (+) comp55341_c0_seq1:700-1140(+)